MGTPFRRGALACMLLGAVLMSQTPGEAAPAEYPTATHVWSDASPSKMRIECTPVAPMGARRRIKCQFAQVLVSLPPTPAEVASIVAKEEQELRAYYAKHPDALTQECARMQAFAKAAASPPAGADSAFTEELRRAAPGVSKAVAACSKQDLSGIIAAMGDIKRAEISGVCSLSIINAFEETLDQLDADTWVGTDGPRGTCHVTVTTTLWRKVDGGHSYWSFKQVAQIPENQPADALCSQTEKVRVTTLKWDGRHEWTAGCQRLKL